LHPHPCKFMSKGSNPDQYLQRVGNTYYARVRVPRTLEKAIGQTHLRRSLHTSSRVEANLKKHAVVGEMKAQLVSLQKDPAGGQFRFSFEAARIHRDQLVAAKDRDDDREELVLIDAAVDGAEQIERLYGSERANRWYRAATTTTDTLSDLMDKWLSVSDYKASTNSGHRKALAEVLAFLKNDHAVPSDVTRKVALKYLDDDLTKRGLSYNTLRDRLASLGGFWKWMQSRDAVPPGINPWTGHKLSKQAHKGRGEAKRTYTDEEFVKLLQGDDRVTKWPTYPCLRDLVVLGLYTGARLDSLCSLTADRVELQMGVAVLSIKGDKSKAGTRPVGVTNPAALKVIERRAKGLKGTALLFPELSQGGYDKKLSSSSSKAYGRYRRACGVPDGTDFHSFRRNVVTVLEAAGVHQVAIARFVGHKVGTMAADVYSQGGTKQNAIETSRKIKYSREVEAAVAALVAAS
jgi:integrase